MGRPTELDVETADRICGAIRLGSTWVLAARAGGVSASTLREWKRKGRAGIEPYAAFLARLKEAETEAIAESLKVIRAAASDGAWQASAWLLERRYPKAFGRRDFRAEVKVAPTMTVESAKNSLLEMVPTLIRSDADFRAALIATLATTEGDTEHDSH